MQILSYRPAVIGGHRYGRSTYRMAESPPAIPWGTTSGRGAAERRSLVEDAIYQHKTMISANALSESLDRFLHHVVGRLEDP